MDFSNVTIFEGKTLANMFEEIYDSQQELNTNIDAVLIDLKELVNKSQSVNDAITIAPIIRDFFESTIKNNAVLLKIADIVQKAFERHQKLNSENDIESEFDWTPEEIEELKTNVANG